MPTQMRPRRSALYLPASNPRAIAKARTLACDVVILDLEDAVAAAQKGAARAAMAAAVTEGGFGAHELVVRVNGRDTEWGADDLAAVRAVRPAAVLLPKIDGADAVAAYRAALGDVPLWAMVETAASVLRLDAIAAAPGLSVLVFGTNDLAKELGATPGADRLPFHGFLAQGVAAARAHARAVLDGVFNAIDDAVGFAAECAQAVRFGFDGKTLIHPSQIAPCHAAFAPPPAAIAWAEAVVAAFAAPEAAGQGAIRLDGRMVERLHLDEARHLLAQAQARAPD